MLHYHQPSLLYKNSTNFSELLKLEEEQKLVKNMVKSFTIIGPFLITYLSYLLTVVLSIQICSDTLQTHDHKPLAHTCTSPNSPVHTSLQGIFSHNTAQASLSYSDIRH